MCVCVYRYTFLCTLSNSLGIHQVQVALLAEKGEVLYDPHEVNPEQIMSMVVELGFGVEPLSCKDDKIQEKIQLEVRNDQNVY